MCGIFGCCGDCSDIETKKLIDLALAQLTHRGPDGTRIEYLDRIFDNGLNHQKSILEQGVIPNPGQSGCLGFKRLSIMGTTIDGMQPHRYDNFVSVCNGEIYNAPEIMEEILNIFKTNGLCNTEDFKEPVRGLEKYMKGSDCKVIIPQYVRCNPDSKTKTVSGLDKFLLSLFGEFSLIVYDAEKDIMTVAVDAIGARQLYYGVDTRERWFFASELKSLIEIKTINQSSIRKFPAGHYWRSDTKDFTCYYSLMSADRLAWGKKGKNNIKSYTDDATLVHIRKLFEKSVEMKLRCDVPYGFLLSGGLDSSLNVAAAHRLYPTARFKTFTIAKDDTSPDIIAARKVAKHIRSDHYEYFISYEELFNMIPEGIQALESWDTTTIRAFMWQYALCKKIRENHPEIKVLICGEVADELWGSYRYNAAAPSAEAIHEDRCRLLSEINMYDGQRTDKACMAWSFEARVPHYSNDLLNFLLALDPKLFMFGKNYPLTFKGETKIVGEKYLLREAFAKGNYLPEDVLWRRKEAFSDSTSSSNLNECNSSSNLSWKDFIAQKLENPNPNDISYEIIKRRSNQTEMLYEKYGCDTNEKKFYLRLFIEYFGTECIHTIPHYWMPPVDWFPDQKIVDPSAVSLSFYNE